jgi:uncharacterized RDD family membrane protein YckC
LQCPKCGVDVTGGAESCPSCGEAIPDPSSAQKNLAPPAPGFAAARQPVAYAGFWLRAVSYFVDLILLSMVATVAILMPLLARGAIPTDKPWFLLTEKGRQVIAIQLLVQMVCWLYFASFESSSWQATPGKKILGLKVTDLAGNRLSFARASLRFFGKLLSQFLLFFGFVMAGFTQKKQALHDMMAGCLVLKKT